MFNSKLKLDIVDFHSHILPGADHGTSSVENTLTQLMHAKSCGIKRIIATPHFYPMVDNVDAFLQRRAKAFARLSEHIEEEMPQIKLGAEVMMCTGIDRLPGLEHLFVDGTRTLLMEFPHAGFQSDYADSVYRLVQDGVNVIVAHPERYDKKSVECVLDSGAKLQCNAHTLVKVRTNRLLRQWVADKNIVAIGSDIHKQDFLAYHSFVKAVARMGDYSKFIKDMSDAVWDAAMSAKK